MDVIGIVGLGLIGGTLARRLVDTGVIPVVYDLKSKPVDEAVAAGATAAGSARELARQCDLMLVCVQTDEQCRSAVLGDDGLLAGASPGNCVAVLSTVLPQTIFSLAEQARAQGVDLVDTPVAGRGMYSVEEGTMAALVGDDGELVERLEPVLSHFASNIVRAGPLGSGAALKLAHNVIVYAGFAATIEAEELARAAGVRTGLVEQVARGSGALSELSAFHLPMYRHLRDEPHTPYEDEALAVAAQLLDKDLSDAVQLGGEYGIELPVARLLCHSGKRIFPIE